MATEFRLPTLKQRTAVIGRTGSGKTQFGAWLLSLSGFDKQPFVMVDYKGDDLLNSIDRVKEIGPTEVPKFPGLYIIRPDIRAEEAIESWLWKIWEREKIGLYFDETYMVPNSSAAGSGALQAILTQGRSKRLPVIALSQRPAFLSRFVFTEADFFAVFHLNTVGDQKRVGEFIPGEIMRERLPEFSSRWYDVGHDFHAQLAPVPKAEEIQEALDSRLKKIVSPRKVY